MGCKNSRNLTFSQGKRRYGRGNFVSRPLIWAPKLTLGCSFSFESQYKSLDGEQYGPRVVHFSLQVPLECTCNADLWSKSLETYLSHGKLMHHRASLEPRVLQMCSSSSFSFPVVPKPSSGAFIFIAIVIITILM